MTRYDEDGYPIRDMEYKLEKVREAIAGGLDPVDAVNRNCDTIESYTMLDVIALVDRIRLGVGQ